jgi:glycosyltransferase involved in cell wall biosynthesis
VGEILGEFSGDGALATLERTTPPEPLAPAPAPRNLKILHVLRAPLGGLFRHVLDVAQGQAERGHRVGLIVDSLTGGPRAAAVLAALEPRLALGVERVAMRRQLSLGDTAALRSVARRIGTLAPDVLHGHGAKGAALVRLIPHASAIRVYTPHGGSLVYAPGTLAGGFYRVLERLLSTRTDLFLFESSYIAEQFRKKIGTPRALVRIVRNGVGEAEFAPVAPRPDATDLISVGELRSVKGFDVLIEALAALKRSGRRVTATIAGDGPDGLQLKALTERLGVADQVRFVGHQPAREAFTMGRILVVPSRAESLPYIVLEAAAAGIPIVASQVGGIPEIFGAQSPRLIPADSVTALADAIAAALDDPGELRRIAQAVTSRVRDEFSVSAMVDGGIAAYGDALTQIRAVRITNF